jgi:hypothetical protein
MPTSERQHHCYRAPADLTWPRGGAGRLSRRHFGLVVLSALAATIAATTPLTTTDTAWAASACDSEPEQPAVRPVAPAAVAAALTEPFAYAPNVQEQRTVVADVVQAVSRQAADLDLDGCYREKPQRIASRVDFLSPYEFLVVSMFDQEPARRDALLDQYAVDSKGAIKALGEAYPSTRAQAVLASYAYFDLASARIRVNAAKVPPAEIRRVLVHEFWHAMPQARTWTVADGRTLRASGFWLQEQRAGRRTWVPLEDRRGLPYASYLLDEAMATLMETRYAGPSRFARPDLQEVQGFLDRLIGVAGTGAVMSDFLGSQPYELGALAEAHRASFPELEPVARP